MRSENSSGENSSLRERERERDRLPRREKESGNSNNQIFELSPEKIYSEREKEGSEDEDDKGREGDEPYRRVPQGASKEGIETEQEREKEGKRGGAFKEGS